MSNLLETRTAVAAAVRLTSYVFTRIEMVARELPAQHQGSHREGEVNIVIFFINTMPFHARWNCNSTLPVPIDRCIAKYHVRTYSSR